MIRRRNLNIDSGGVQLRKSSSGSRKSSVRTLVLCLISFYLGLASTTLLSSSSSSASAKNDIEQIAKDNEHAKEIMLIKREFVMMQKDFEKKIAKAKKSVNSAAASSSLGGDASPFFDRSLKNLAHGMSKVSRLDFVSQFDFGSPTDKSKGGDVIMLYNNDKSIPTSKTDIVLGTNGKGVENLPLSESTKNCDWINVVTIPPKNDRVCTALLPNTDDWHIRRWKREGDSFKSVNRGQTDRGRTFRVPTEGNIKKHWGMLETYFKNFDEIRAELEPIAKKIAKDNTIIVMTCNMGQSELLMNFVCNAKAKGLSTENVLVFPTDQETKDLAEGLGLATFYDEKNFGRLPSGEARAYGDGTFTAMMFAKVVCVQIINFMGYDLLFQDVDVVWYKNPLEYFHDKKNPHYNFDMYFQDDGARSPRYAPYSANSGFYYVRNNEMTKYFFTSLLYSGDQILECSSHQQVLIQVMTEHASHFGLRVKVLERDMEEFPGGWHYHKNNKTFMKKLIDGKVNPQIFHMSWTKNKDNKIKFFQQMAEWYTEDKCIQRKRKDIADEDSSLVESCCLSEPNIVCHYRDKPSKIPCKDSDPIDKGHPSFW